MDTCCLERRAIIREQKKRREKAFEDLTQAVWKNDLRGVVTILARNSGLVHYNGFVFHLPEKTTSIVVYAEGLGHETIVEVLRGFAAA